MYYYNMDLKHLKPCKLIANKLQVPYGIDNWLKMSKKILCEIHDWLQINYKFHRNR